MILTILITFIAMEGVAWFTHKYIMHGALWYFHKDHHTQENEGYFEKNDFFFLIFALPGMLFILLGSSTPESPLLWIGVGISLYGFAYFVVHDIFIHQRFKILRRSDHPYFRAIRKAHKVHHKRREKENGECFGMLWVPFNYFREAYKTRKSS